MTRTPAAAEASNGMPTARAAEGAPKTAPSIAVVSAAKTTRHARGVQPVSYTHLTLPTICSV